MTPSANEPHLDTPHRILIVDDNVAIHEDFRKILARDETRAELEKEDDIFFGTEPVIPDEITFDLHFAAQGREALEQVIAARESGRPFSVVFMDVRMPPGWDGIETTARLWEIDPDLQVVICTAYSDYSWQDMVGRLGTTDRLLILKKPFDVIEVVQCAHALAGKWSLLQKTRSHAESLESTVRARTSELETANRLLETANRLLEAEIVERRRNEEVLRLTQFSVDNASDAMFWAAPDSRLLYVNAATCLALGYTARELHGMSVLDIVPELYEGGWEPFCEILRHELHRTFETAHLAKDGRRIPIEIDMRFFTFEGQELICVSSRDITHRRQILEELSAARDIALESVRLKSQFLANVSHEIRTPMNGVLGMAELMCHTDLDRDQKEYINAIHTSAHLLLNIINDILDTTKIESGMLTFETLDFDLNEVIEGTMDVVGVAAQARGIELAGYLQEGVCPDLRGDPGRLRQILSNIVGNAVKFTERGEVVVGVSTLAESTTHTELRFEVRDTGIGIAEDARARIFEPFIQADSSDTRRYGGTGLGLTICRQFVEALGGSIGIESEAGKGSTFWFNLSFEKQTAQKRSPIATLAQPRKLRVLVVDDNPTNRAIMQIQFANIGMRSSSAAGGEEALDLLRKENIGPDPFHCAVLDTRMPGMGGLELARQIKSDPLIASTRLILLSSLGDHVPDSTLSAWGIDSCLIKPLRQTRLRATMTALLEGPLSVPLSQQEAAAESMPPAIHSADSPLQILLVEDNPVNQRVALLQLKRLGYPADVANDGIEALEAVKKVPYDVILMDCQMPNMDGYSATREIRRIYHRPILIIAMTANAMKGDREKCLAAGMDDHLGKPVDFKALDRLLSDYRKSEARGSPPRDSNFGLRTELP